MNSTLSGKLKSLYVCRLGLKLATVTAYILTAWLTTFLAVVVLDAIFGFNSVGLHSFRLLAPIVILAGLAVLIFQLTRSRFQPLNLARDLEEACQHKEAALVNAVSFSKQPDAASAGLRALAVDQGIKLASELPVGKALNLRPMMRALGITAVTLLVILISYLIAPRMYQSAMARLWNPDSAIPAYTSVLFDVQVNPNPVMEGESAVITVSLSGMGAPEQADIVFQDSTRTVWRYPMLRKNNNVYEWTHDKADQNLKFHIATEKGRSKDYELNVLPRPRLKRLNVTLDYPAYTGWEQLTQNITSGGIQAPRGTQVTLTAISHHALSHGEAVLHLADGTEQTLRLEPLAGTDKQVSASLMMEKDGYFTLQLIDPNEQRMKKAARHSLIIIDDTAPTVTVTEPAQHVIAPMDWKVQVKVKANDDIGVHRLFLSRSVNGWGANQRPLSINNPGATEVRAEHVFDLNKLGASPGDVINYQVIAEDDNPYQTGRTRSQEYVIRVVSAEEYAQHARATYKIKHVRAEWIEIANKITELDQQRRAMLRELNALDKELGDTGIVQESHKKRLRELHTQLQKYDKDLNDLSALLVKRMNRPNIYEFDEKYRNWLRKIYDSMEDEANLIHAFREEYKWADEMKIAEEEWDLYRPDLRELLERMKRIAEETEERTPEGIDQMTEDMKQLTLVEAMQNEMDMLARVAQQQERMMKSLDRLSKRANPDASTQLRLRQVAEDQMKLRYDLETITATLIVLADMAETELPEASQIARELAENLKAYKISKDMADASKLAQAGEGRYATISARSAHEKLDSLFPEIPQIPFGGADGGPDGPMGMNQPQLRRLNQQMRNNQQGGGQGEGESGGGSSQRSDAKYRVSGVPEVTEAGGAGNNNEKSGIGRGNAENMAGGNAEQIQATEHREVKGSGHGSGTSTPGQYREEVEAYFRRLGDDSRG